MNFQIYRTSDELAHHGVEGQKWGRRRYQNEDGSYKPGSEGRYDPEPSGNGQKRSSSGGKNQSKADKAARKAEKKAAKAEKNRQRAEYAEKKHQERQVKRDEKASKDSYKKVALRYAGRKLAGGLIGAAVGNAVAKKTGNYELGTKAARAVGLGTSAYNGYKTFSDARNIYNYRKRKSAKHSDILEYDALYHGENGVMYGIRYS